MAIQVFTNALVLINAVDLSDHTSKVTITDMRDSVDITAFGATSKTITKGLGDANMSFDMFQDFATSKTHQTLVALISSSTGVVIEVRGVNAARSATNPAAVMTGLLMNYSMLDGKVGDASDITLEFQNASQTGIQYLTS